MRVGLLSSTPLLMVRGAVVGLSLLRDQMICYVSIFIGEWGVVPFTYWLDVDCARGGIPSLCVVCVVVVGAVSGRC